jgi:hypothetical protein
MSVSTTYQQPRRALGDVDFPAGKDQLVDQALASGADEHTVRALRAIPPVKYRDLSEVLSSVPLRDKQDVVQSGQQAQTRRTHTKPGLAESAKDVPRPTRLLRSWARTGKLTLTAGTR